MKAVRRILTLLIVLGIPAAAGWWMFRARQVQAKTDLPTAASRRGVFQVIVRCRGELVSLRSVQLTAPFNIPGLQIVWQAPANAEIKEGEPVVRFDSSAARAQLREKEAALQQADATLDQANAQARMTAEQDRLDLSAARVEVERAKLEASKQEIVSKLQGEASRVDLGLAEEKLRVTEAAANLHKKSDESKIASLTRQRDKAQADIDVTKRRLEQMEIKAPSNGVVVYLSNYSQGWMNAKPFKVGDQVWPGSAIAELPDLATLEIKGKLEETDRGRVTVGQETRISVDPFPESTFAGTVSAISPLVEQNYDWPPTRNFRAQAKFSALDKRLRPAMNGRMDVIVERIPDAISVPANAVFPRQGRPTVFIQDKGEWVPKEVQILAKNPDEVAVKGIGEGVKVSLVEPDAKNAPATKGAAK
jgi:multidrug efflux pump subunit AcrA (membrane-fusion protein)